MDNEIAKGIAHYLTALKKANDAHMEALGLKAGNFSIAKGGRKYAKIQVSDDWGSSVVAFVEKATGLIWKADGWKAPAKNFPRGSVLDLAGSHKTFDVWHSAAHYGPAQVDAALADMGLN